MKLFPLLLVLTFIFNTAFPIPYNLRIQFPSKTQSKPSLIALYKGCEYVSTDGIFEIHDERSCSEFHVLITENLKLPNTPDIEYLETSPNHSYKLFKLTRKVTIKETTTPAQEITGSKPSLILEPMEYWDIEELNHNEAALRIPDTTIIMLMNPDFIKELISETWRPDDSFIKLPKCIFNDEIEEKMLQEVSTKMVFASLDLRCLHKKVTKTTKSCAHNKVISVLDPIHCYALNTIRI